MGVVYNGIGAGNATATSGADLTALCPATVTADDILIAHVMHRTTNTAPTTPSGWTLLYNNAQIGATLTARHWLFGKIADGTEDGTSISFGTAGGTAVRAARIYRFTGRDAGDTSTIDQLVKFDTGGQTFESTSTVSSVAVSTNQRSCYAVCFAAIADDNALGDLTGETGGDFARVAVEFTTTLGLDLCLGCWGTIFAADNPGTITAGSYTMAAADPWGTLTCYIRPNTYFVVPEAVKGPRLAPPGPMDRMV